jgi:hypothetical protein
VIGLAGCDDDVIKSKEYVICNFILFKMSGKAAFNVSKITRSGRKLNDTFFRQAKVITLWHGLTCTSIFLGIQDTMYKYAFLSKPCLCIFTSNLLHVCAQPFLLLFPYPQQEGYVARSAYKLLEIQEKHKIIPPGGAVLDLGCHPGAWLQVACQALGPPGRGGLVLGVDIQETVAPGRFTDGRVKIVQADARALPPEFWAQSCPGGFDTVLSDMVGPLFRFED